MFQNLFLEHCFNKNRQERIHNFYLLIFKAKDTISFVVLAAQRGNCFLLLTKKYHELVAPRKLNLKKSFQI